MRRILLALLVFGAASVLLLTTTSCEQRTHVLRVANVNQGLPVYDDIADWYLYNDPQIPDSEEDFEYLHFFGDDTASVEFQYVEIGAGLPTWTPYHVTMTGYTVWYRDASDTTVSYDSTVMPMTLSIPVDREGKKTVSAKLVVATADWTARFFASHIGDNPTDGDDFSTEIQARMKFSGFDSVSNRKLEAWGNATIRVSDFWDDPSTAGR
jgi:hypothetical protein